MMQPLQYHYVSELAFLKVKKNEFTNFSPEPVPTDVTCT